MPDNFEPLSKKESKYIVLKIEDVQRYFSEYCKDKNDDKTIPFYDVLHGIRDMRIKDGKRNDNEYILINRDESYSDYIWKMILLFEELKEYRLLSKQKRSKYEQIGIE